MIKKMCIAALLFTAFSAGGSHTPLAKGGAYAQAAQVGGKRAATPGELKKEDYITLVFEGNREIKLFALSMLVNLGARDAQTLNAFLYGLEQGTFLVERENGRVLNDYWDVRATSASALGELGNPSVLPHLYRALRFDHDLAVRTAAAASIGKLGQEESVKQLERAIETANPDGSEDELILASVQALGRIGVRGAIAPLVKVVRGPYTWQVRFLARDSLREILRSISERYEASPHSND